MSQSNAEQNTCVRFADLSLSEHVQNALQEIGYETPSPIQAKAIPHILEGRDIIGQAQTGTGKTAAFSLPLLSLIDPTKKGPHALILAPTRELALQVAEAIAKYGRKTAKLSVAAIYGGTDFFKQFKALERNPAIVVGTPGRVMDHMRRGTLDLSRLSHFILDEADEMLRMGFIDDVEWILEHTPSERQTALFSATMPPRIAAIARKQLHDPVTVSIKTPTATVAAVGQRFVKCSGLRHKLETLSNLLETEETDASIIFTRTKSAASMVAEDLLARGLSADAIHGDISQSKREQAVSKLKNGALDILVATDVAARGLDVDRISHVFNFDIPDDVEPYIHRIGRCGRAGRSGEAIALVTNRDMRKLREIERVTRQRMDPMSPPSPAQLAEIRQRKLEKRLSEVIADGKLDRQLATVRQTLVSLDCDAETLAAALLKGFSGHATAPPPTMAKTGPARSDADRSRPVRAERPERFDRQNRSEAPRRKQNRPVRSEFETPEDQDSYRIEVGRNHRVKPGNIVGAITNEAGLEGSYIGRIEILDDHSIVNLPTGMPREILQMLKKTWVAGQQMRMTKLKPSAAR